MTLTYLQITNAKSGIKPYKLPDTGGLYVAVQPPDFPSRNRPLGSRVIHREQDQFPRNSGHAPA